MIKMANLTLHNQESYVEDFKRHGFEIQVEPQGLLVVDPNPETVQNICKEKIAEVVKSGYETILLGGRSDIVVYLYQYAKKKNLRCYIVHTERERKIIGEKEFFDFNFKGLTEIL